VNSRLEFFNLIKECLIHKRRNKEKLEMAGMVNLKQQEEKENHSNKM